MKIANMKKWFHSEKKFELNQAYHCQMLERGGEIIGETEKAYKLSVMAVFMNSEKPIVVWCPKSCVENICEI